MKTSEVLRKAAERCQEVGFDSRANDDGPSCFARHIQQVVTPTNTATEWAAVDFMADAVMGGDRLFFYDAATLRREGWTTPDAVAALSMAADIAQAEGL